MSLNTSALKSGLACPRIRCCSTSIGREGLAEATDTASIPYSVLAELKKQDVEHYIEFLKEESLTQENNTVKKRGNAVVTLSVNALKLLFNYLMKETASRRAQKISSVILNEHKINDFLQFVEQEYVGTFKNALSRQRFNRDKERDLAILSLLLGSGIRLGEMNVLDRDILVMKFFLDMTNEEIALHMGLTKAAIDKRIYRGKKRLQEKCSRNKLGGSFA
ncbi:site-specific tyrosine recombinase XerS [Planococcus sp. PAMC 21323]|uniref:sigma factor-like helix-turn-helix DNA-binding protein n=1 Tax=Planococcus sp. PAMC 21323 TaxID=1526927 RepID=UPI000586485F|nr:sigma factor-like helix-turn-helix DNA-binding protein [Planococcus sp. PAMC 21323]AIY05394.1 site-specific tyrosine recombinase XerS [Planococcus sp. PAMC 21323]